MKDKSWQDEYLTMIEDCEKRESRLSEWEVEFMDSIRIQVESGKMLSPKQLGILDRVWERATS